MKKEVQNILRIRIAANILYRINRKFTIEYKKLDIYDFIVSSAEDNFRFAVKVGSSTYLDSAAFTEYINILNSNTFMEESEQIPIVLMCVNESTEEARMGIILGWKYFKPVIYKEVSLQVVNAQNWLTFEDHIKAMDSIIRILSEKTISIIKRIKINEVDNQGRYHTAEIIYLRTFSNEYKMQQKEVVDEKEDFKRMIYGIPENEYPSDMLDKDLLEVVQQKYPTAKVKSSLMLFNSELRDFEQEIRNYHYYNTITLILEPDFQEIMKLVDYLDCLKFQFNLYVSSLEEKEFFGNMYFSKIIPKNELKKTFEYYSQIRNSVIIPKLDF